jgi:hypothetical protein
VTPNKARKNIRKYELVNRIGIVKAKVKQSVEPIHVRSTVVIELVMRMVVHIIPNLKPNLLNINPANSKYAAIIITKQNVLNFRGVFHLAKNEIIGKRISCCQ